MVKRTSIWVYAFITAFMPMAIFQAQAQSFPNRPVHIVVGVSPGGASDFAARILAQHLSQIWGEPVVVENRLGAAGAAANEAVAKAPADGYTLLLVSDDITALSAYRSDLPYDLLHDLTPVSLVSTTTNVLAVNPSSPVHTVSELISLAKAEPGKLTFASGGVGGITHLETTSFASTANIDLVHIPYKGSSAAVTGVAAGEADIVFASPTSEQGLVKAGKLRMIAISSAQRSPLLPSVPAISETLPGFSYTTWFGLFAPAGIPNDVLAALNGGVAKAVNLPEVKAELAAHGEDAQTDSPAQFAAFVHKDLKDLTKIVKKAGLKAS